MLNVSVKQHQTSKHSDAPRHADICFPLCVSLFINIFSSCPIPSYLSHRSLHLFAQLHFSSHTSSYSIFPLREDPPVSQCFMTLFIRQYATCVSLFVLSLSPSVGSSVLQTVCWFGRSLVLLVGPLFSLVGSPVPQFLSRFVRPSTGSIVLQSFCWFHHPFLLLLFPSPLSFFS